MKMKFYPRTWLIIGLVLTTIFSLLLFDLNVSIGGDDSSYIIGGMKFWKGEAFPTWHGSLYPIFLGMLYGIFGLNLLLFKFISLIFILLHLYFFYKAFNDILDIRVLLYCLCLISANSIFLYYASQTYSEAMYLFLQALIIYVIFTSLTNRSESQSNVKIAFLAVLSLLAALTRNVGLAFPMSIGLFFLISRNWKALGTFSGVYLLGFSTFQMYKKIAWNFSGTGIEGQLQSMLYKNFYRPSDGTEDMGGLIVRFWDNSNLYLSKHFIKMIGLRSLESNSTNSLLTIFIIILFAFSVYWSFRNEKFRFISFYLLIAIGVTFVTQQQHWDQERLILIYLPILVAISLQCILSQIGTKHKILNQAIVAFMVISASLIFIRTINSINLTKIAKNLEGDIYYGFSPDMQNYLSLSSWVGENISKENIVACRKPSISSIYAGNPMFYGIYKVPENNGGEIIKLFSERNVKHAIVANLRLNPKLKTQYTINTVKRTLTKIIDEDPYRFEIIRKEGSDEAAYLLEIKEDEPVGNYEKEKRINAALVINQSNIRLLLEKVDLLIIRNEYERSIQFLNYAENIQDLAIIHLKKGNVLLMMHNPESAIDEFVKCLALEQNNSEAFYGLSIANYLLGNTPEVIKNAKMAINLGYTIKNEKILNVINQ